MEDSITHTSSYEAKVGEVHSGQNKVADLYQTQTISWEEPIWAAYQGRLRISPEALFRLAGDTEMEKKLRLQREDGERGARIANYSMLGGCGAAVLTLLAPEDSVARLLLAFISFGTLTVGPMYGALKMQRANPDRHDIPMRRAVEAAQRYNARLELGRRPTTLSVGGSF
jgi:hypothetical protein